MALIREDSSAIVAVPSGCGMIGYSVRCVLTIIGSRAVGKLMAQQASPMSTSSRRFTVRRFLTFLVLATLVVVGGERIRENSKSVLIGGPMVQIPEPGRISFSWRMSSLSGGAVVLSPSNGPSRRQRADQDGDRFEASFDGLRPGEQLSYRIEMPMWFFDRTAAGPFEVSMPPPKGKPFRFLAFGDSGNGSITQADLAKFMVAAKPDLIIHTGDLVYPSGRLEDYPATFFEPYAEMIRRIPFMPSLGNHDCATDHGEPFIEVFNLPRNGPPGIEAERNYWFDFGDARFVALDANPVEEGGTITNEQRQSVIAPWLRHVLTNCDARWKFVYFHHPFYTGSEHPESGGEHMKKAFMKVFEDCGVDIVFCGHNHLYERTAPMRQDKIVPDGQGVVYVTTGAGGNSRYTESRTPPTYIRAFNDAVFSFTQVDVSPGRLELKQIGEDGKAIDNYGLSKPAPAPHSTH